MEKLLSDKEVARLAGAKSKVLTYPQIAQYDSIEQLFGGANKIVLLYLNDVDHSSGSMVGHWCGLMKNMRGGKRIIEFYDPYGGDKNGLPDEQLKHTPQDKNITMGQGQNYLTRLLYKASLDPNTEIHYNEKKNQRFSNNVNTCGRHVGARLHFNKVPLEQWQKIWMDMKKKGLDLDNVVTKLTNNMLQKKNIV